ncbi:helix-turn-helix transcriptional regulator [uncultured Parvibaculum sp.]|uniref:helix-turn-helix domain-containing protein n=1 Tax=uncultured Parvibaculum sp. TaxID=291828 RepID=UPI0030DCB838|tara:strand:- start:14036 stop:14446 length:411 start_codon:yes stop_codon:yes gene_type:complete
MAKSNAAKAKAKTAGNPEKRGSFATLIGKLEKAQREKHEEVTVSSAAFRAAAIIRMMRKSRKLSQTELARRLGVSQARISEIESGIGAQGPSWDLMERIARACGSSILIVPPGEDFAIDAASPDSALHWKLESSEG